MLVVPIIAAGVVSVAKTIVATAAICTIIETIKD